MASSKYWQKKIDVNYKNEICEVFELASQHYLEASFVEESRKGLIHHAVFTFHLTVGDFTAQGHGPTKYDAKLQAARQVLPELRRLPLPPEEERANFWRKRTKNRTGLWQELPQFKPHENPVTCLEKVVTDLRGKPVEYTIVDVNKETDPYILTVQLVAADQTVMALGISKRDAKKNAAAKMLNLFGYNFLFSEPEPKPKEEVKDVAPEEVTQGADGTPREDISAQPEEESPVEDPELPCVKPKEEVENVAPEEVIQEPDETPREDISAQPEEEPSVEDPELPCVKPKEEVENVAPEEVTQEADGTPREDISAQPEEEPSVEDPELPCVEVTSPEEDPAGLTQEDSDEAQSPVDLLELLPADVLPMLAAMGVVQSSNHQVQWCEPSVEQEKETPSAIASEAEIRDTITPDVTQEDELVSEELQNGPDVEEIVLDVTVAPPNCETIESINQQDIDNTHDTASEKEEIQPKVNLQVLPAEILSKLVFMGLIAENNGIVEWVEPTPSTTCQEESDDVSSPKEDQASGVPATETNYGQTLETELTNTTSPKVKANTITTVPESMDLEKTSPVCETEVCKMSRDETLFLTRAFVKKVFEKAGSEDHHCRSLIIVRLKIKIQEHLIVDGQRKTRVKDLEKIGKRASKHLIAEYGSADALLRALQDPDTTVLEAAVVKHLNSELRAFQNRPKSALSHFFSGVRRAFTRR